jgi:tRNA threonylcarbamoyladenosine biosynthesis protein TsaB
LNDVEPRFLIVETSGRSGLVAIARGSHIKAVRRLDQARRHARDLVPNIAELLQGEGWKPKDVQAIIVSVGPGSYTGLRVGIMSAKAFAYATGCKLIDVETFAAIAMQAPLEATPLDVIGDAQQDKIYVQSFADEEGTGERAASSPLTIRPLADWMAAGDQDVWITGPGLRIHQAQLARLRAERCIESNLWDPRPETLLQIGLERYRRGQWSDLWRLEPIYLRPSSAEEKWHAKEMPGK